MFLSTAIFSLLIASVVSENPTVNTRLGKIEGSFLRSRLGKDIFSFRGIRYAKAPVGDLRFQPPVPVEKWSGIYDATVDGPLCPQPDSKRRYISEDCLFLNVYTTKLTNDSSEVRPVIVYIHAGGFYSVGGSSDWAGPEYLLDKDIVLVTINYRLATLGFLSTGTAEAPGNNGLKDQVTALKWVRDNILQFGGDPNSVTISGYSAGGMSVILHLVSPMSQGLFHRAIAQSGSSLAQWSIDADQVDLAKKQAKFVGCPEDDLKELIECLKTVPAAKLGKSLDSFFEFSNDPVIVWKPVIENDFGQERFLSSHPIDLVAQGKFAQVPLIVGVTKDEFAARAWAVVNNDTLRNEMNKNFEKVAPIAFLYERDSDNSKKITRELRRFYFDDKAIAKNSSFGKLIQVYAEGTIGFGVNRAAKMISEKNTQPVYYYRFSYKGRFSHFYEPGSNNTIPFGTVHHDDLIYLYYIRAAFPFFNNTDPEIPTVEKYTSFWENFAKTGNPTPETNDLFNNVQWPAFNLQTQKYLDFGDELKIKEKLYNERYDVWQKLFPVL